MAREITRLGGPNGPGGRTGTPGRT
jgi:hypothetical protein